VGFESFLGNSAAVDEVRQMLKSERLPGALLFPGPEGVGKKTLALMLAKALVCERRGPGGDDFCGKCRSCRKAEDMIVAGRQDLERRRAIKDAARRVEGLLYFDVQLIEPITRVILMEQVRQLRHVAYTHPFELPRRIFIIDSAQALHWQAVDVLLKVLEEPPDTTILILVCPSAYELRPTIRSRCRSVQFLPAPEAVLGGLVARVGRVSEKERALATRLAAGSVAKALTFDLDSYRGRREAWLDFIEVVAGKPAVAMTPMDWRTLFQATRALAEKREDFNETLQVGYSLLRDLMLILAFPDKAEVANLDLVPRLKYWAPRLGISGIEKMKAGLDQAYRLQIINVNQQLGFDALTTELLEALPAGPRESDDAGDFAGSPR
jgi:DNA polymerase-3 subunit delta'